MTNNQIKLAVGFILTAMAGGLLGVLVQIGNLAAVEWYGIPVLAALGELAYGLFFWIFICSTLAFQARNGAHAALLTLTLLLPMLCCYSVSGLVLRGWFNGSVTALGFILLIPSALAAWVLRANRKRRFMRVMVRLIGTAALMFDILTHCNFSMRTMMLAMPMLVLFWYMMHCVTAKEMRRVPQNPVYGMWDECPMF